MNPITLHVDVRSPVEWLRGFDKTYSRHYWFNVRTEESRWQAPDAPWIDEQPE